MAYIKRLKDEKLGSEVQMQFWCNFDIFCKKCILVRAVVLCSVFLPLELVGPWFHKINFPSATFCRTDQNYDFQIWELRNIPALYPKANSAELYWRTLACHICVVPVHQNWRKGVVVFEKSYFMHFMKFPSLNAVKCPCGSWQFLGCLLTTTELVELMMIYISLSWKSR